MSESMKNALEWGFKILSVIILPIMMYVFSMSTELKLEQQKVETQGKRIEKLESKVEKIEGDLNQVQLNSQELRQMRTDLVNQNAMMREVYNWVLRQQGGAVKGGGQK